MKIILPGGSGQIGGILARHFHRQDHEVVVLSRRSAAAPWRTLAWNPERNGDWRREFDGADVVINLAGRSVNCRYGAANRRDILESRLVSTRAVGEAIRECGSPPRVWLQGGTATIYAHTFDAPHSEDGELGGSEPGAPTSWRFSVDVARAWEAAASEFALPRTRLVLMRTAMVMSPDRGGVFDTLYGLTRWGLGGPAGSGRQYVSWINDVDLCRAIDWLIARDNFSGPVNLASPCPLPYAEFMAELRRASGVRWGLPATEGMLAIGTWLLRTESELVLKSRRVFPGRLLGSGFEFAYEVWKDAARDLVQRRRGARDQRLPNPLARPVIDESLRADSHLSR